MAHGRRSMLRLPSCLRSHCFIPGSLIQASPKGSLTSTIPLTRSFGQHASRLARQSKNKPPRLSQSSGPPKPGLTVAQSIASRGAPVAKPKLGEKYIDTLGSDGETTLLYAAPKHGLFCFLSYLVGSTFLFGAYSYAQLYLKDKPDEQRKSWYVKVAGGATTLFMAIFGTAIFLAPTKMIKSIAVVSGAATARVPQPPRMLRLEVRRWLPFLKPDVLETTPSKLTLDKNVPSGVSEIAFINIPMMESRAFTEAYFSGQLERRSNKGLMNKFSEFNRSLLSAWPAMKREVGRMCLREHIAYVRAEGNGNFKLDLQGCSLLEMGRPLDRLTVHDPGSRLSVVQWMRSLMRG